MLGDTEKRKHSSKYIIVPLPYDYHLKEFLLTRFSIVNGYVSEIKEDLWQFLTDHPSQKKQTSAGAKPLEMNLSAELKSSEAWSSSLQLLLPSLVEVRWRTLRNLRPFIPKKLTPQNGLTTKVYGLLTVHKFTSSQCMI